MFIFIKACGNDYVFDELTKNCTSFAYSSCAQRGSNFTCDQSNGTYPLYPGKLYVKHNQIAFSFKYLYVRGFPQ